MNQSASSRGLSLRTPTAMLLALLATIATVAGSNVALAAQPSRAGAAPRPAPTVTPATPAPVAAPAPIPAASTASPTEAIEDQLMAELAKRDMDKLLEFYFQKHNVPKPKQDVVLSGRALKGILDPATPPGRKRALLLEAVKGTDLYVSTTRDTEALMNRAALFVEHGMKGQINQIEYFGETSQRLMELNQAAEAVMKILDKAIAEAEAQQAQLLAGKIRADDATMKKWQQLDDRAAGARWTRAFSAYGLAMSMDPANPKRKTAAESAIAFLKDYEAPEFQREAPVRVQIGKLHMVIGNWDEANKKFKEALAVKGVDKLNQYEARFYTTLCNLLGKRDKAADTALADLQSWNKANLSAQEQKEVSAGVGLLEYRINDLKASLAKDPAQKRKFGEAGEAALSQVMKDNPQLEPVIKRMMLEKLPADVDVTKLDTILLRSLLAKGVDEYLRAKDGPADDKGKPVLERAVNAAHEIEKRKGQPAITPDVEDEAAFLPAMFLTKLQRYPEAIEASLEYIKDHGKNKDRAILAIDNALGAVDQLRKDPAASVNPKNAELISRTWKTAIAGGRREYTFVYGKRLFDQAKNHADYKAAAEALKAVPANHPAATHARFFQLTALQELVDDKTLDATAHKSLVAEIQKLAADVNQRIESELAKATPEQKKRFQYYQAASLLLSAELTQEEQKDHKSVVKQLEGFEQKAAGLPGEEKLIGTALHLRVNSLMALGQTADAVAEVKKLVETGAKGAANILYQMLTRMDESYDAAKANGDREKMRILSAGQAQLVALLIEQTKDENAKNLYREREAVLLLRAAQNESDTTRRQQYLAQAQEKFAYLMGLAQPGTSKHDNMRYRLALISFELKDYKKVQQELGQLIQDGKLGPPDIRVPSAAGDDVFKENPVYWEGLLCYMRANYELSKTDPSPQLVEAVKNNKEVLKALFVNRGKNVGGDRFRDEFAKLKVEWLPGWDESKISTTQPSLQPATQPAAPAATQPAAAAAEK